MRKAYVVSYDGAAERTKCLTRPHDSWRIAPSSQTQQPLMLHRTVFCRSIFDVRTMIWLKCKSITTRKFHSSFGLDWSCWIIYGTCKNMDYTIVTDIHIDCIPTLTSLTAV